MAKIRIFTDHFTVSKNFEPLYFVLMVPFLSAKHSYISKNIKIFFKLTHIHAKIYMILYTPY